jgi:hypothetical protein
MSIHSVDVPVPAELADYFRWPPVLATESPVEYQAVLTSLAREIKPRGTLEWLLFKDLVDSVWEIRRYVSAKATLIDLTRKTARRQVLEIIAVGDETQRRRFVDANIEARFLDDDEHAKLESLMHKHGFRESEIDAQAMAILLPELELIDRQLERARANKMKTLRELEYFRGASWHIPDELKKIVDAQVSLVPLAPPAEQGADVQGASAK